MGKLKKILKGIGFVLVVMAGIFCLALGIALPIALAAKVLETAFPGIW